MDPSQSPLKRPAPPSATVSSPDLNAVNATLPPVLTHTNSTTQLTAHPPADSTTISNISLKPVPPHAPPHAHTHHSLALASLHHALHRVLPASQSTASTPRASARSASRDPTADNSQSPSRASSADRASSIDRGSRPASPSLAKPSPAAAAAVVSPAGGNNGGGTSTASSSVTGQSSSSHQRQSTIFDPLPPLPSRLRQATLKLVPPPVRLPASSSHNRSIG